ncbi:hypothetical protein AN958_10417 [Leucoagaricus sp. SymC.cos]|nr:hypothetical protein AN958_10417 [Leucoagaricus sp. SymC.cos]
MRNQTHRCGRGAHQTPRRRRGCLHPMRHSRLRTPSPGPNLLAKLSNIIKVDTSGVSKYVPPTPSTSSARFFQRDKEQTMRCSVILRPPTSPPY